MASRTARLIIFPLSNPTERSEATPAQIDDWTEARAVIGTGSPFPLKRDGKAFRVDQTNNAYVYPGIGLGAIATGAQRISDGMFLAPLGAVAAQIQHNDPRANLLPLLRHARSLSTLQVAVGKQAQKEGLTRPMSDEAIAAALVPDVEAALPVVQASQEVGDFRNAWRQSPRRLPATALLLYQRAAPTWNGRTVLRVKFVGTVSRGGMDLHHFVVIVEDGIDDRVSETVGQIRATAKL